jgi:hypothetical protein
MSLEVLVLRLLKELGSLLLPENLSSDFLAQLFDASEV